MIDARSGALVPADAGFTAAHNAAMRAYARDPEGFQRYRVDHNTRRFNAAQAAAKRDATRRDSFGGDGFYTARELEYISARVAETKYPIRSSFLLFPRWPEAPIGAKKMTIERMSLTGEAHVGRGGKKVPRVGVTKDDESFKFAPVYTARETDIFDRMADVFAGGREEQGKQRAARKAILDRINQINWFGDKAAGLYGVLTYPWLAVVESSVVIAPSTADADIVAELNRVANWPAENSSEVFAPNKCVTSKRLRNRLANRKFDDTGKSILKWIIENNEEITEIQTAPELREPFGDAGVDGMLFYRDDVDSIALNMPMGIEELPVQKQGFAEVIYTYTLTGGVIMIDSGHNVLVLFEIDDET